MATTTNFGWETPDDTDLVKDGALAMRTLGNAIDASLVDLKGGTTGQVLSKASNTDLDYTWVTQDDANAIQNAIVDAKGDLIAASAADTPARLAVGNNGETLVADSSASTGLRWQGNFAAGKNKIINGDFGIWQRGTSFTTSGYTADRFFVQPAGGQTVACSRQTFTPGTAPVSGYESNYFFRFALSGTPTGSYWLRQRVEDVRTFAGQTVTLSFWAKASSNTSALTTVIVQNFGSGGSGEVVALPATGYSLTTSWQRFSFTATFPSISGKTIGTNSYLDVRIAYGSNSINGIDIDYWGVQLEAGNTATAFQTATGTLAGELAACQRYYLKSYAQATAPGTATNTVGNTGYSAISATATNNRWNVRLPVNMRGTPTITIYSTSTGTSAKIFNEQTATDIDGLTQYIGESGFHIYANSGTITAGQQLLAHYVASAEL